MASSGSAGAVPSASVRHALSYGALSLGVVVVLVSIAAYGGLLAELFGGDFVNVGLFGLLMGVCASLAIWTAGGRADRLRAVTGVVLCLLPVAMLVYFLAFTVS